MLVAGKLSIQRARYGHTRYRLLVVTSHPRCNAGPSSTRAFTVAGRCFNYRTHDIKLPFVVRSGGPCIGVILFARRAATRRSGAL